MTLSDRLRICIASGDGLTKGTSELLREAVDAADELDRLRRAVPSPDVAVVEALKTIAEFETAHGPAFAVEKMRNIARAALASLSRPQRDSE